MRITEQEVHRIAIKILTAWKEKKLIEIKDNDSQVIAFLQAVFIKDLQAEDDLNKEVEVLLKKYDAQISAGMDRRKMFQMIKNQLIKDRKLTI